jgi:predicted O-methyltransferase YrrM
MNIIDIEKIDTVAIAKLVLAKLDISFTPEQEAKLLISKEKNLAKTISGIESIEKTWKLENADDKHTYGRKKPKDNIYLWSVPPKSAQVLENLIILTGAKNILEIGTSAGYAALHLAHGASQNNGHVYTIELLKEKIKMANENFKKSGLKNITLLEGEASEVLKKWSNGKIDFVFLDADKENYGKYLDLFLPLMKIGGVIVADNINDYGHMMEDYLKKVSITHLSNSRIEYGVKSYYLAALDHGLMITKKISD